MSKIIGVLGFLAACFYGLTVITLYGYNGYFGIPYNYIEYSPIYPIVFFFDLLRIATETAKNITFLGWVGLFLTMLFVAAAFFFSRLGRWGVIAAVLIFVLWLPFGFYNFGRFVAANTVEFFTTNTSCIPGATAELYIAPTIYEGQAVFVPVSTSSKTTQDGLLARSVSDLTCELKKQPIGPVRGR